MSRTVRRQLIEILNTLKEANKLLENLFESAQETEAVNLLAGCQNCAITMGNKIEAVYGTGTASVHALEEYCEIIFQLSQNIQNQSECLQIYERMKEQLLLVEENMEQEIPDKQEVVFMPYKASMWDALESVYLAAKEDESCEAYVVPIPYFDLNSDHSFGEMHYEGNEYPKNIEVIDWQSYNLEARMPDVIYIHNPYDDWNRVTSVHPKFYSSNLKKYTEKLVYIPYFVLQEIEPDDQAAIDQVKHFFFLPGIINADRVIVQSEKMKQIYINEYLKSAKAFGLTGAHLDRKKLEEKFLGLGSPKFDKVLNTRREDLEIPEEWLRIIEKPDGTWKKIIFYNTSITALLQYDVKMLEKMRYVFRVFKEQQEEVALLWRPHPLIPSTIKSMRPHLWKEYEKIVEDYKCEGWGIYDDTADMDRAVALSDAYYGDHSSVVQVYQKTKKKICIQNCNCLYDEEKVFLQAVLFSSEAIVDNDKIWFSSNEINALFAINCISGQIETVTKFPMEKNNKYLFLSYTMIGNNIFFAPCNAENMWKYNILSNKFTRIDLGLDEKEKETALKFKLVIQHEDKLYLFGYNIPVILQLDIKTNQVIRKYEIIKIKGKEEKVAFIEKYCINGNKVYILIKDSNNVFEYDLEQDKYCFHYINDGIGKGFGTILFDKTNIILSNLQSDEIIWDIETDKVNLVKRELLNNAGSGLSYVMETQNGRIYFGGTEQVIWNNACGKMKKISYDFPKNTFHENSTYWKFGFAKLMKDKIYFQERGGEICVLNTQSMTVERLKIVFDEQSKSFLKNTALRMIPNISLETEVIPLRLFIKSL